MEFDAGSVVAKVKADISNFKSGMEEAQNHTSKFKAGLGELAKAAKVMAVGIGVGAAAATAFGIISVKAYSDSQDRLAQLNAVLKSTGGVAGVTAKQATDLAASLQKVTKFSDEEVLSAENLLLTFTKIGKNIMPQATETVLNMATALGEDTKSAAIQLGKALQDPILGITALRRVGVNFSDKQKEVIQKLVDTGKSAEAQKLILKELNTEFGNSARMAGDTFSGKLAKLKNSLNDVEESVGKVIVDGLAPFATKALEAVASIDWTSIINKTVTTLRLLYDTISGGDPTLKEGEEGFANFARILSEVQWIVIQVFNAVKDVALQIGDYLAPKIDALWHTIQQNLIPTLYNLWQQVLLPLIQVIGPAVGTGLVWAIGLAIDILNALIQVVTPVINWMIEFKVAVIAILAPLAAFRLALLIQAAIDAFVGGLATARAAIVATRASVIALNASLVGFTGFAVLAAAAIASAALVVAALISIKNAYKDVENAAKSAQNYDPQGDVGTLIQLSKNGTPAQQQRAKATLKAMAVKGFASGVENFTGGLAYVHQGELLVNMPKGTDVIPKDKVGGAGSVTTQIYGDINIGSEVDADNFLARLSRNAELARMGLTSR